MTYDIVKTYLPTKNEVSRSRLSKVKNQNRTDIHSDATKRITGSIRGW